MLGKFLKAFLARKVPQGFPCSESSSRLSLGKFLKAFLARKVPQGFPCLGSSSSLCSIRCDRMSTVYVLTSAWAWKDQEKVGLLGRAGWERGDEIEKSGIGVEINPRYRNSPGLYKQWCAIRRYGSTSVHRDDDDGADDGDDDDDDDAWCNGDAWGDTWCKG